MATITWGGSSGDWSSALDWHGFLVPGSADTAVITGSSAITVTLDHAAEAGAVALQAGTLALSSTLSLGATLSLSGGILDLAGVLAGGTLVGAAPVSLLGDGGTLDGVLVQGGLENLGGSRSPRQRPPPMPAPPSCRTER